MTENRDEIIHLKRPYNDYEEESQSQQPPVIKEPIY